ncbi:MAG: cytochrome P460 family protein [Kofleriaceae bacterium]
MLQVTKRSALLILGLGLAACADDASSAGDAQTPPTKGSDVEAWIADGMYKAWKAETAVHAARSPSPHGFNRIFVNDLVAANAAGTAVWPKGSATVKELYDSETATTPIGYAVSLKLADDTAAGANWYWYERIGSDVVADGNGDKGAPLSICVGCHTGAGVDVAHTPTPGARDQIYSPLK